MYPCTQWLPGTFRVSGTSVSIVKYPLRPGYQVPAYYLLYLPSGNYCTVSRYQLISSYLFVCRHVNSTFSPMISLSLWKTISFYRIRYIPVDLPLSDLFACLPAWFLPYFAVALTCYASPIILLRFGIFFQDPDFFAAQPNLLNLLVTFFTWRNFFSWFDRKRWFWFVTLDSLYCTILYCTYFCRRMNWTLHTILPNHRRLFSHSGASERDFTIVKFELWVQQNLLYSRVWFTKKMASVL